jgi:ABC-type nitrate/sulfonate/bicarbonate transport system permease component
MPRLNNAAALAVLAGVLALWQCASAFLDISPLLLPSPVSVAKALATALASSQLWTNIVATLIRSLGGFALGCVAGIPLGLLMGVSPKLMRALSFWVDFLRSVPPIVFLPILVLLLGVSEGARTGVAVYGCGLTMVVNSSSGVVNAPTLRRRLAQFWGFSAWQRFRKVVFWEALPQIFVGARTAASLALVLALVAEMLLGAPSGLGRQISNDHLMLRIPEMYAMIVITGLLGYTINVLLLWLEGQVVHWAGR